MPETKYVTELVGRSRQSATLRRRCPSESSRNDGLTVATRLLRKNLGRTIVHFLYEKCTIYVITCT